MSGWESLREVDVMSLWPPEQRKNIESTKWQERKESLENLLSLIKKNPKLSSSSMVIYGELMDNLKKIISRDSNINVVISALHVLSGLAYGLKLKFSCYISMIWSVVLDKAKDKKASVRTAVDEALDALSDTGDVDRLCKDLCEHLLKPNPQSKQCICSFLYRLFKRQQTVPLYSIKTIIPILIKLTEDGDQTVRDGACSALGSVKRLLGKSFEAYVQLIGTEKSKLDRIEYYYLLAQREWEEEISSRTVMGGAGDSNSTDANSNGQSDPRTDNVAADYDPWILMEPVDISVKINPKWEEMVNSKKWQERREAVEILITLFESTARVYFTPILAEVIESLIKVLDKDVNINVSSCAAKALARLAIRLRTDFASSVVKVLVICFDKLKERKTLLRNELIELADAAATTLSLTEYADAVVIGMQSKNPQSRAQTAYFIARLFSKHNTSTVPVEGVNHISSGLVKCSSDADAEVRDASFRALGAIWRCMGDAATRQLLSEIIGDKIKMDKIMEYYTKCNEEFGMDASVEMKRLHILGCHTKQNTTTKEQKNYVSLHPSGIVKTVLRKPNRASTQTLHPSILSSNKSQFSNVKPCNHSSKSSSQTLSTKVNERTRPISARPLSASKPNIGRPTTSIVDTSQNTPHSSLRKIPAPHTVKKISNIVGASQEIPASSSSNMRLTSGSSKQLVNNCSVKVSNQLNQCSVSSRSTTGIRPPSTVSRLTTGIPRLSRPSTPSKK